VKVVVEQGMTIYSGSREWRRRRRRRRRNIREPG
jgi:hypothetical protein